MKRDVTLGVVLAALLIGGICGLVIALTHNPASIRHLPPSKLTATGYYQQTSYYAPVNSDGTKTFGPLAFNSTTNDWRTTPQIVMCLKVPVTAGELLNVTYWVELANDNVDAIGGYSYKGVATEHWTLWMMGANYADANPTSCTTSGATTGPVPQQETNWNNYMHYLDVQRSGWWVVPAGWTTAYISDCMYFNASNDYIVPPAVATAQSKTYGRLEVAGF